MKLDKDTAQGLLKIVRKSVKPEKIADDAIAYNLDDILAIFNINDDGKQMFSGLTFEMLGRDFHILPSLDVMLSEMNESGTDDDVYSIEDDGFMKIVNDFILWRTNVLETLGV